MNPRNRWRKIPSCRTFITLLLVIVSGFTGCAPLTAPPAPAKIPVIHWQLEQLIGAMERRRNEFRSLRALARVEYAGPDGKRQFQEAILVQRPDRLRLETLSFLGAILIVTVNDREMVGYQPREDLFLRGRPSRKNLFRTLQIPLELDEITALLIGLPPVDPKVPATLQGHTLVFSSNGQKRDEVDFEFSAPVPTGWKRFDETGEILVSAQFADYVSTAAGLFPSRVSVSAPLQGKRLEIHYEKPELNISFQAGLFSQQKPANVKELPFEALGG